ncbi:unannotated protein [freshwater metagenome]|uniref:Unannotated protein n=1 Tax=freshwater metagenome TaxID=449393 RepID=A0A6J7FA14_9ZZZZ|nr:hypothetical protein [Actinomycetota bacterium]
MKRTLAIVAAVVIAAALAIVATRPGSPTSTSSATTTVATATTPAGASAPRISQAAIDAQHDEVTAPERGRIARTRLLDATLVTAAQAHGVSITAGTARASDRAWQDMVITAAPDLTVREIASAVSRICSALNDPCERRDYRFLIQTPTGQAVVPARLIHPKD